MYIKSTCPDFWAVLCVRSLTVSKLYWYMYIYIHTLYMYVHYVHCMHCTWWHSPIIMCICRKRIQNCLLSRQSYTLPPQTRPSLSRGFVNWLKVWSRNRQLWKHSTLRGIRWTFRCRDCRWLHVLSSLSVVAKDANAEMMLMGSLHHHEHIPLFM